MKKRKHWWVWLFVALYIYFIFRNSMMIADVSSSVSSRFAQKLSAFLVRFGLYTDYYVFHHYVRKFAHVCEFAGLGFLVTAAMHICPLFHSRFMNFVLFLFSVPFADETIQRYIPGRSSDFNDMMIDGTGFLLGGFVCYVLILIIRDLFFRKKTA
ncbi:MAG: VanZ family protein [Solobacterium sp.]|nr:VanZ family protein [Solobacterium sp.]